MLPSLSRVPVSDWILIGFVAACGLLAVLPELLPGKRRDDEDDPPDTAPDDVLAAA